MTLHKDQWGPYFWNTIHYTALGYPEDTPSVDIRAKYKDFYEALGFVIPCMKCSKNYINHIREIPIDPFLVSRDMLFKWTVNIHNIVNKEIGKPHWNEEIAKSKLLNLPLPLPIQEENYKDENSSNNKVSYAWKNAFLFLLFFIILTILVITFYKIILKR
jgi:hypothetical protein